MQRNLIALILGVLLSFLLPIAGARLAWILIVGNVDYSENKDALVRLMLVQRLGIAPAVSVVVSGFVAAIARRSGWWLGVIAVSPLILYGLIRGARALEIVFSVAYVLLAFATAFVVSRLH